MRTAKLHPAQQRYVQLLVSQGKDLAREGQRSEARQRFTQALVFQPSHVEALLWLAGISDDPQQSIRYLSRVLEIAPHHPAARAGLRWARRKVAASALPFPPPRRDLALAPLHWLDRMLLSGAAIVCLAACALLSAMIWQAPEAIGAALQPTAAPAAADMVTPSLVPAAVSTATSVPPIAATDTPSPIATDTLLPTPTNTSVALAALAPATPLGSHWIDIDLSDQRLVAYEGETPVLSALVSTGISRYPTPTGEFQVRRKVRVQSMSGPGYYVPNVEWVLFFHQAYALHGTYWHRNFGHPMSHGCINMTNEDAQWIFQWAPIGTPVRIHQ